MVSPAGFEPIPGFLPQDHLLIDFQSLVLEGG